MSPHRFLEHVVCNSSLIAQYRLVAGADLRDIQHENPLITIWL